jgi:hypothetical protein
MGLGDFFTGVGNSISNGVSAVGDAAGRAYDYTAKKVGAAADWTADKAKAGYNAVRRTAVRGELWVEDKYKSAADFLGGFPECEDFPPEINYDVFDRAGPPAPPGSAVTSDGGTATVSPQERTFIYLDVGRWGGSNFYPPARDFGLVCGRTAVLCAFRTDKGAVKPVDNPESRPEIDHINALIAHLNTGTGKLGQVHVRRFATAHTMLPNDVNPAKIYVIVGDMHLPIVTDVKDTYGPRMGRQPGADDRDTPEQTIVSPDGMGATIPAHTGTGSMVEKDALDWYSAYTGANASGAHEKKGADIFEQAGDDLTEFVNLLTAFHAHPLHLMQLGDMIDLWMGLERFFVENSNDLVIFDTNKKDPDPTTWVNYWTDRALNGTSQSPHVQRFLSFNNGDKTWLYGNHDDYFAVKPNPNSLLLASGNLNRESCFDELEARLYAAHGHEWDSSNKNGVTRGQSITQLAFSYPSIRKVEPGGRRDCIVGACELFLKRESNPFCIFAMGHTHVGVLTKISIVNHT